MIVGNGDIANALKLIPKITQKKGWIFFASGVSNSQETRESEYAREKKLLLAQNKAKHLVYFGTLAVFYNPGTRYVHHKLQMEKLVKEKFKRHTIVRIGNIAWGKNPNTLINFMRAQKKKGVKLNILNTYRYLVEKQEFLHWIALIPDWNCEMNITGTRLKVKDIVKKYVK